MRSQLFTRASGPTRYQPCSLPQRSGRGTSCSSRAHFFVDAARVALIAGRSKMIAPVRVARAQPAVIEVHLAVRAAPASASWSGSGRSGRTAPGCCGASARPAATASWPRPASASMSAAAASRSRGARALFMPPGTAPVPWMRLPAVIAAMTCCPYLRSFTPFSARSGYFSSTPTMLRRCDSLSKPNSRSGDDRWKKCSACDCRIWPKCIRRRSFSAVGVSRSTPTIGPPPWPPPGGG